MHLRNALAIGPRLYLRPGDPDDAELFAKFTAIDPDAVWDRIRLPSSQIGFRHYITEAFEHDWPEELHYTVCLKENDQVIGDVGLHTVDWVNRNAETSAWLGDPAYRDRGYGTEAKFLLLDIAFEILHLHVLVSWIWEPNGRSAAAVQKQGYRPAGRDPFDDIRGGRMRDGVVFDLLRDEYLVARAAWEQRIAQLGAEVASAGDDGNTGVPGDAEASHLPG